MASARALILTAVLLACLLAGPTDGWFRRRRRRRCPAHTSALPGAINKCPLQHGRGPRVAVRVQVRSGLSYFNWHYWSPWINTFDHYMNYACPFNGVVTGFQSEHSNSHEDRRWKVRCSVKWGMTTYNHYSSLFVNNLDGNMNYYVPSGFYIRGMHGYHDNGKEDRRYSFHLCRINL
ncbi:hemagglutinin/amebocyte aggregation factor-like [Branchiostoma floridae]|uniref:Hemagglutinin/amebocyte aggregation factor-like n=1 Tax=Branchiostoma floridae TaxID=7739 RepID=A0A9J7KX96_BRAFL|nr:hemagglutinin/amebocyte aggregation factor-like [Branchiostoma floridae]